MLQSAYKKGKWWALIHSVPLNIIKSPKIVCPQRSRYNVFGYDDFETYRAEFPHRALYPFMLDGSVLLETAVLMPAPKVKKAKAAGKAKKK